MRSQPDVSHWVKRNPSQNRSITFFRYKISMPTFLFCQQKKPLKTSRICWKGILQNWKKWIISGLIGELSEYKKTPWPIPSPFSAIIIWLGRQLRRVSYNQKISVLYHYNCSITKLRLLVIKFEFSSSFKELRQTSCWLYLHAKAASTCLGLQIDSSQSFKSTYIFDACSSKQPKNHDFRNKLTYWFTHTLIMGYKRLSYKRQYWKFGKK